MICSGAEGIAWGLKLIYDGYPLGEMICSGSDGEPGDGERVILQLRDGTTYYCRVKVTDGAMTNRVTFSITALENIWLEINKDD